MNDDEILHHLKSLFTQIMDRMDNIEGRMATMEKDFAAYCEHNPKMDEQWAEERLRALENQTKYLTILCAQLVGEKADKCVLEAIKDLHMDDDTKKQLMDDVSWALNVNNLRKEKKDERL